MALLLPITYAAAGLTEPLWLDELHSSWVLSGRWEEVAPRAAMGNQTSLYFFALWILTGLTGQSEVALRMPSLIAWWVALVLAVHCILAATYLPSLSSGAAKKEGPLLRKGVTAAVCQHAFFWPTLAVLGWMGLDRIQVFYSTEARPYAMVQLVVLVGWYLLWSAWRLGNLPLSAAGGGGRPDVRLARLALGGCVCCGLAVWLHLASVPVVAIQLAAWGWLSLRRPVPPALLPAGVLFLGVLLMGAIAWDVRGLAVEVWARRRQWNAFAGDTALGHLVSIFPFLPWIGAVGAGYAVSISAMIARQLCGDRPAMPRPPLEYRFAAAFWGVAWLAPLVVYWGLTAAGVAPLLHSRYLLPIELPLAIFSIILWLHLPTSWLRTTVFLGGLVGMLATQGTLNIWADGYVLGWQRGEDWRAASRLISRQWRAGDRLSCWAGLLEGETESVPVDGLMRAYLSFPLRGMYQVRPATAPQGVDPIPLVGGAADWRRQWEAEGAVPGRMWIVFRGPRRMLDEQVERLERICAPRWAVVPRSPAQPMGRISVIVLDVGPFEES
ncbi:MAG: hypothetical protein KatS3mg111_2847 [Pirellulaceae bacterium]|nr:MAG: hypothetical protein KatS3mg111_2847 [Pirellulaceae bacterium]